MELKTLKAYIKTNLANKFIKPSKLLVSAPIFFNQKSDGFLRLCFNYWGLNNFTINNQYPLALVGESLNRLGRTRWFTQLDFISENY